MTVQRLLIVVALVLALGWVGCGSDDSPTAPGTEVPLEVLAPDPDGMLLPGEPDEDARGATVTLAPSPVAASEMDGSLLKTRLAAFLAPGATVGEVNAALAAQNAAIVSMVEGDPYLVLVIDAVADRQEAETMAAALVASGAFLYARPGHAAPPSETTAVLGLKDYPADGALERCTHLLPGRVPAAWNLRRAANSRAALIMSGYFAEAGTVPDLPLLQFASYGGRPLTPEDGPLYRFGNFGYHNLSVAAGTWAHDESRPHTGADPVAAELLDMVGVQGNGLDWSELILATVLAMNQSSPMVVLSAETFHDPEGDTFRYLDRAYLGLRWRHLMHSVLLGRDFLHVVPAGNTGESDFVFNSADFNSFGAIATILDLNAPAILDGTEEEQAAFAAALNASIALFPDVANPTQNVLIVGSSDASGAESSFSTPGSQVRTVGEGVSGTCLVVDCQDGAYVYSATVTAAAQVAGLAAYMWHLDPSRSVSDLLLRLQHAYSASARSGILDASIAVLSLDNGVTGPLRRTLLDVSGPNSRPDGAFTEYDIEAFLDAFDAFEGAIAADWSVYDLNGDGWTNGENGARMDLDVNNLPGFTSVSQLIEGEAVDFSEGDVTDEEVLCYYAYSDLYTGNATARTDLLGGHCGSSQETLPGSSAFSDYDLEADGFDKSGKTNTDGSDDTVIDSFGDFATTVSSNLSSGGASVSGLAMNTAGLHREAGGTVTLDIDALSSASANWSTDHDRAEAETGSQVHVGLELVGEHTVTLSGRLTIAAASDVSSAGTYVHVGPDSTLYGWTFPTGSWRYSSWDDGNGTLIIEPQSAVIPDGVHRIWVNVHATASANDDSGDFDSGSRSASAEVQDLLVTITPTDAKKSSARVISGR